VASCDVLLLYCAADELQFGSLLECGAALAEGKTVFVIAPHAWPFLKNHSKVRSLEGAIECLVAMAAGERARRRAG
jgi:hypothetical protein